MGHIDIGEDEIITKHGGYRKLKSFESATLVYDLTVLFCDKYKKSMTFKTYEQMTGAARSGRQNIGEGSQAAGTNKELEIKLVDAARFSQEELLLDYEDFLRQRGLPRWDKNDPRAKEVRSLAYRPNRSYKTYLSYFDSPENAANAMLCLTHQTKYLLDRQLASLGKELADKGDLRERLKKSRSYQARSLRGKQKNDNWLDEQIKQSGSVKLENGRVVGREEWEKNKHILKLAEGWEDKYEK